MPILFQVRSRRSRGPERPSASESLEERSAEASGVGKFSNFNVVKVFRFPDIAWVNVYLKHKFIYIYIYIYSIYIIYTLQSHDLQCHNTWNRA